MKVRVSFEIDVPEDEDRVFQYQQGMSQMDWFLDAYGLAHLVRDGEIRRIRIEPVEG